MLDQILYYQIYLLSFTVLIALFYLFILISARTQESETQKPNYLIYFSVINLVLNINKLISFLFTEYYLILKNDIFDLIFFGIEIIAWVFLFLFARFNKKQFGSYLLIFSIFFIVNHSLDFISSLILTPLFISGVNLIVMSQLSIALSSISITLFYIGIIFLIINAYKNKDIYLMIAGVIHFISLLLWIMPLLFPNPLEDYTYNPT